MTVRDPPPEPHLGPHVRLHGADQCGRRLSQLGVADQTRSGYSLQDMVDARRASLEFSPARAGNYSVPRTWSGI